MSLELGTDNCVGWKKKDWRSFPRKGKRIAPTTLTKVLENRNLSLLLS